MRPYARLFATASLALLLPLQALAASLSIPGIENFHQVNERIYRGAQPEAEAWPELAKLGVKTVIDLRREGEHSTADEKRLVEAAGMRYVNFPMRGFDDPTSAQMTKAIALMDGEDKVFVHCKQGRDRTGTVVAAWRIARENWTNKKALDEANACKMNWFMGHMKRFVAHYKPEAGALAAPMAVAGADSVGTATSATVAAPATP